MEVEGQLEVATGRPRAGGRSALPKLVHGKISAYVDGRPNGGSNMPRSGDLHRRERKLASIC